MIKNIYDQIFLFIRNKELKGKLIVSISKRFKTMKLDKLLTIKIFSSALGAICGFLYWRFVGCSSGTCPIKSVWYWSTLWGMAMGYLLGDLLGSLILKQKNNNE